MKVLSNLCVTVEYTVQLSQVEVSDEEAESLFNCFEKFEFNGLTEDPDGKLAKGLDWLNDHIEQKHACDVVYDIDDIEIEE